MKKTILGLALILTASSAFAQFALDLAPGSQVRNSIIFQSPQARPVSAGVVVTFSASDSVLPAGNNNVLLLSSPFSNGFRIDMESLAFDGGNHAYLRASDTLDLDFNPRTSCRSVDIGAFEFQVLPTQITVQPTLTDNVYEGTDVSLYVEATGHPGHIAFQWQRNGVDLYGETASILTLLNVSMADTGYYRVIVIGPCYNDTSALVRVDVIEVLLNIEIESDMGCFYGDGWAFAHVREGGVEPFTFLWNTGATTQLIENLTPGIYTVEVTDYAGDVGRDTVTIGVPPAQIAIVFTSATVATNQYCDNASMTISVFGGVAPYYFEWRRVGSDDIVSVGQNLINVRSGAYTVTVIDSRGCQAQLQNRLRCEHEQIMPTILITPNDDGLNDFLYIPEIEFFPVNTVTIINSYGAGIITIENFCNHDPNRRWDGRNRRGNLVPDGTYWYVVQAEGIPPMTGWIIVRGSPGR